jgi:hypothetical protein
MIWELRASRERVRGLLARAGRGTISGARKLKADG